MTIFIFNSFFLKTNLKEASGLKEPACRQGIKTYSQLSDKQVFYESKIFINTKYSGILKTLQKQGPLLEKH